MQDKIEAKQNAYARLVISEIQGHELIEDRIFESDLNIMSSEPWPHMLLVLGKLGWFISFVLVCVVCYHT